MSGFWRSVVRYDLVLWPLVSLPLLVWIQQTWRRRLSGSVGAPEASSPTPPATAPRALDVGLLLMGGWMMLSLLLQLRFAAVFHRGGWGF